MKTVFVTGADRGVGFALCEQFVSHGWRVLAGQYMPEWPQLAELAQAHPEQLTCIPLNVGDAESVRAAARAASEQVGTIDMLINCAGVSGRDGEAELRRVMNVNALGPIRMVEAFLPLMENGMKRLCFVSSEAGSITLAHRTEGIPYCASKHSLNMAVRLMFEELKDRSFTFRLYHPGWVRSYMSGKKGTMGNFEPEETAEVAYRQFTTDRDWEDVLMMTDVSDEIWSY